PVVCTKGSNRSAEARRPHPPSGARGAELGAQRLGEAGGGALISHLTTASALYYITTTLPRRHDEPVQRHTADLPADRRKDCRNDPVENRQGGRGAALRPPDLRRS